MLFHQYQVVLHLAEEGRNPCIEHAQNINGTLLRAVESEDIMTLEVLVHSVPGQRFTQAVTSGRHVFFADRPESQGGSDKGPGPYSYLLAALGS